MKVINLREYTKKQSTYIKLIAIITMFLDHLGLMIYPELTIYRIVGRIAFPLFAFQLGIGYIHTQNKIQHIIKVLIFALLIQSAYIVAEIFFDIQKNYYILNIFFTLFFGLLLIYLYDKRKNVLLFIVLLIPVLLELLFKVKFDYGLYGIALIFIMYIFNKNTVLFLIAMLMLLLANCIIENNYLQLFSLFTLLFILMPIEFNIKIPNNIFYIFYPLHLIFLYMLQQFI